VRICPNQRQWNDVYQRLLDYADVHPCKPGRPPRPLTLGGSWAASDTAKLQRWQKTVDWAVANNCTAIIAAIPGQSFHHAKNATNVRTGSVDGLRSEDSNTKERPSSQEREKRLNHLRAHWADIVGPGIAAITRPVGFSGKKSRRLLVQAAGLAAPPWGGWNDLARDKTSRSAFALFRAAVNKALVPHQVDHIEFVVKELATTREDRSNRQSNRVHSIVRQPFSIGKSRAVRVERPPANRPMRKTEKQTLPPIANKKTPSDVTVAGAPIKKTIIGKRSKHEKKKAQLRRATRPSFFGSTGEKSPLVEFPTHIKGRKRSRSKGASKGPYVSYVEISAGLPGNEDVDPPTPQ
jgi:hypothetical protein